MLFAFFLLSLFSLFGSIVSTQITIPEFYHEYNLSSRIFVGVDVMNQHIYDTTFNRNPQYVFSVTNYFTNQLVFNQTFNNSYSCLFNHDNLPTGIHVCLLFNSTVQKLTVFNMTGNSFSYSETVMSDNFFRIVDIDQNNVVLVSSNIFYVFDLVSKTFIFNSTDLNLHQDPYFSVEDNMSLRRLFNDVIILTGQNFTDQSLMQGYPTYILYNFKTDKKIMTIEIQKDEDLLQCYCTFDYTVVDGKKYVSFLQSSFLKAEIDIYNIDNDVGVLVKHEVLYDNTQTVQNNQGEFKQFNSVLELYKGYLIYVIGTSQYPDISNPNTNLIFSRISDSQVALTIPVDNKEQILVSDNTLIRYNSDLSLRRFRFYSLDGVNPTPIQTTGFSPTPSSSTNSLPVPDEDVSSGSAITSIFI